MIKILENKDITIISLKKPTTRTTTSDAMACDDTRTKGRGVVSVKKLINVPKLWEKFAEKETLTIDDKEVLKESVYRGTIEFESRENEEYKDKIDCQDESENNENEQYIDEVDCENDKS